jgi:hypothetical protein
MHSSSLTFDKKFLSDCFSDQFEFSKALMFGSKYAKFTSLSCYIFIADWISNHSASNEI